MASDVDAAAPMLELESLATQPGTFQDAFRDALQRGKQLAGSIGDSLQKYVHIDPTEISRLIGRARSIGKSAFKDTRIIALRGDTGQGKSSLINSLLGYPGLAKTSGWTQGTTTFVTEYRYNANSSKAPFQIEVDYLTGDEIEAMISELLLSYRRIMLPDARDNEGEEDDREQLRNESEIAWHSLGTAFGHHAELRNLCDKVGVDAYQQILDQLLDWAAELDWPDGCVDGKWKEEFISAGAVAEAMDSLSEGTRWPFVENARVYADSPILEAGIVLVDLPGQRDVNLARVKLSEEYLLQADHVLIVVDIKRAVSSESLKSALLEELQKETRDNPDSDTTHDLDVSVVCTHADAMDTEEAMYDVLKYGSESTKLEIRSLETQIQLAVKEEDLVTEARLKWTLKYRLIKGRNKCAEDGIRRTCAPELKGNFLNIHCVGNREYKACIQSNDFSMQDALGVPQLRRYCTSIAAKAAHSETRTFLQADILGLLKSVRIWLDAISRQNDRLVKHHGRHQEKMKASSTAIDECIEEAHGNFKQLFQEQIIGVMDEKRSGWHNAAVLCSEDWKMWHHASYNAWCRHDGVWCNKKRGTVNWGLDLTKKYRLNMRTRWTAFDKGVVKEINRVRTFVGPRLTRLSESFKSRPELKDAVKAQRDKIMSDFTVIRTRASKGVRALRRKALEDRKISFIYGRMKQAYRRAALEPYNQGYNKRQINIVHGRVEKGIFQDIQQDVCTSMATLAEEGRDQLRQAVAAPMAIIEKDFGLTYGELSRIMNEDENSGGVGDTSVETLERTLGKQLQLWDAEPREIVHAFTQKTTDNL